MSRTEGIDPRLPAVDLTTRALDLHELMDDPDDAPEGYPDEGEARTLGLLPIRIVPHWRSDHPEAAAASAAAQELCRRGLTHRCLRGGQVLALDV